MAIYHRLVSVLLVVLVGACSSAPSPPTAAPSVDRPPVGGTPAASATSDAVPAVELPPLPPPAAISGTTPAERAAEIVNAIMAGGDGALPAIEAAFIASGIPVIGDDGLPIPSENAVEGYGIDAWELKLLAGVDPKNSAGVLLSDFGDAIAALEPDMADISAGGLLLEEIKAAAADSDPVSATAGMILAELSAQRDGSDLLAAESAPDVTLDGVQVQLILYRLANDLLVNATAENDAAAQLRVLAAVARPQPDVQVAQDAPNPPCQYTASEKKIIGHAEEYLTRAIRGVTVFDKRLDGVLGIFGKAASGDLTAAQKYARALKFAGLFADLAKIFAALAMLKVDVEMEGGEPLVRTKNAQSGEQKTLVAFARLDPGGVQLINCFRLFFATAGMKFSVPQAETLANKPISWHALEGFGGQLVQFRGNPVKQRTDPSGKSRMIVEGVPHKPPVSASATAVEKHATVRVDVAIKDTTLGGDLGDAVSVALSGPLAPIRAALEVLYRITLPAKVFTFAVRDWELGDYRIDKTVVGSMGIASWSVHYTGTKCDGPAGEWVIDSAGTLTGGGDTAQLGGTIFVELAEGSLSGPMGGTARFTDHDPGGGTVTEGVFGGTGKFDAQTQKLELTVTTGSGSGYSYGFLDTGVTGPGTLTFPVEAGDFCE